MTTLEGLENWDVSNAENMADMFYHLYKLEDASAINNWDIRKVKNFDNMFGHSPVKPVFSLRPGTWDSNGTYIPDDN